MGDLLKDKVAVVIEVASSSTDEVVAEMKSTHEYVVP